MDLISTLNALFANLMSGPWVGEFLVFAQQDPITIGLYIFLHGGWVVFAIVFMWATYTEVFMEYRAGQYMSKWKHVLLAIDIPKNNEQTPKAVENIFSSLAGAFTTPNLVDIWWNGKIAESFSFEIVSIDGHIRFLVRTVTHFRDFIEAAIYSQYPDAEINEVDDYVDYDSEQIGADGQPISFRNLTFPNSIYNLWGAEFILVKPYPYPIRTYPEFEHQASQTFVDPMSSFLEIMSKLNAGENVWIQLVVQPRPPGWGELAKEVVSKIQGREYKPPETFSISDALNAPAKAVSEIAGGVVEQALGWNPFGAAEEKKKEEDQWKMFKITPGERSVLERVETKLSKQAFKVKFRMIYLAKKEVFAKGRGVTGFTGAMQQLNTTDANAIKPGGYTKTAADYFFTKARIATKQNRILRWYCNRSAWYGESNSTSKLTLLNPEELATLWHFPVMTVKAAEVRKIESKKAAPPSRLPYNQRAAPVKKEDRRSGPIRTAPVSPVAPGMGPVVAPKAPTANAEPEISNDYGVAPVVPALPSFGLASQNAAQTEPVPSAKTIASLPRRTDESDVIAQKKGGPPSNLPFA